LLWGPNFPKAALSRKAATSSIAIVELAWGPLAANARGLGVLSAANLCHRVTHYTHNEYAMSFDSLYAPFPPCSSPVDHEKDRLPSPPLYEGRQFFLKGRFYAKKGT